MRLQDCRTKRSVAQPFKAARPPSDRSNRLRQGYGGLPKLHAKAEGLRYACALLAIAFASAALSAQDKTDALSEATRRGDAAAVRKLLDEGVDVNTKFRYDRTALSFACDRGHVDVVKVLLDRGANVNVKDTFYGATALTWAVNPAMDRTAKHTEVVALLLKHGGIAAADLTNALESAIRAKLDDVVAMLEKAGAKRKAQ